MLELNDEIRQALNEHPHEPVRIVDAVSQKTFVLVTAEVYERLTSLLSDDIDPRVGMAMMNEIMAEDDKNDPYLDSYQPETT